MPDALPLLPAMTLRLQLDGLDALGVDTRAVREALGTLPSAPDARVPRAHYETMWRMAHAGFGRAGLPSALAMAIPFGAFGALDYLVASAETLGGSVASAALHFAMVASDVGLDIDTLDNGDRVIRIVDAGDVDPIGLEFTLAAIHARLRHISGDAYRPLAVVVPVARSIDEQVRERIYGGALHFDGASAHMVMAARDWERPCTQADAFLHGTLRQMAAQLELARAPVDPLESAIRARLRGALADGDAAPSRLARLLGVSERTLQRRLSETGRTFARIVEDFRREESERLLRDQAIPLISIADRLGYAEQTSFTRAFRRWTGTTPKAWRTARSSRSR